MSFIRALEYRRFSTGGSLYVFPADDDMIYFQVPSGAKVPREDFCEVMFRILDHIGVDITLEMVNDARDYMLLDELDELVDLNEASAPYRPEEGDTN